MFHKQCQRLKVVYVKGFILYNCIKSSGHQPKQSCQILVSHSTSVVPWFLFFIFFLNMGGSQRQMLHQPCSVALCNDDFRQELEDQWMSKGGDHHYNVASSTSSLGDSSISSETVSSLDFADDVCSSTSNSSSQTNEPLEDFTELLAQLPIKRGLSMFYEGKSQSFTSLSSVKSIEDLPKKENPYSRRLNACKSYAGGLDTHKSSYTLPKAPTFKKASKSSLSFVQVRRGSTLAGCRPPSIPVYDESF